MKRSDELEKGAAVKIAEFMAAAARTAPKARGIDNIEVISVDDEPTRSRLIEAMKSISKRNNRPGIERDANCIASSPAIVVIGVKLNPAGLDCGFCGYRTCEECKKSSGSCSYNPIDLGIALSSAATTANRFHADNRIMYSVGLAAIELGLFVSDVKIALGIPLSITGKNPYFDRK